jgi:hypothetical protein
MQPHCSGGHFIHRRNSKLERSQAVNRSRTKLVTALRQLAESEGLSGLPGDDAAFAESISLIILGDDQGPPQVDVMANLIDSLSAKLSTEQIRDESVLVRELRRTLEEEERRTYALERTTQEQVGAIEKLEVDLAHQQSLLAAARSRRSSTETGEQNPQAAIELKRLEELVFSIEEERNQARDKSVMLAGQLQALALKYEQQRAAAEASQRSMAAQSAIAADNHKLKQELERALSRLHTAEAIQGAPAKANQIAFAPGIPGWVTQPLVQAGTMPTTNYGAVLMKSRSAIEQAIEWKWNETGGGFEHAPTRRIEELQVRNAVTFDCLVLVKTVYKFLSRRIHDEVEATPQDSEFAIAAAKRCIELIAKV